MGHPDTADQTATRHGFPPLKMHLPSRTPGGPGVQKQVQERVPALAKVVKKMETTSKSSLGDQMNCGLTKQ